MMKTRYAITGLTLALAGYAAGALATEEPSAVLQQPKGQVFVGQATAMVLARSGMPLYKGNRVVVAAGGAAKVAYADGCTVTLPENSLLAVGGSSQCKAGLATVRSTGGFQNTRVGQVPQQQSDDDDGPDAIKKTGDGSGSGPGTGSVMGGVSTGPLIIGGLLGVSLIAAASKDNDNDSPPASP